MAKLESLGGGYQLWHYLPSRPAAIIFIIIFFILTGGHTWKLFRNRLWFGIPFVIGGLCKSTAVHAHPRSTCMY